MFLMVLRARKLKEDESGLLFNTQDRREPRDLYPWYQLKLPQLPLKRIEPPILGPLPPREWKWGTDLLLAVLKWILELQCLDRPLPVERQPRAHWQVLFMELALDFEAYAGRPLLSTP